MISPYEEFDECMYKDSAISWAKCKGNGDKLHNDWADIGMVHLLSARKYISCPGEEENIYIPSHETELFSFVLTKERFVTVF